jgi:four helix bundle protein
MKSNASNLKSEAFAVRIVKLYSYLCDKKKEFVLSKQLLRSGTSIGANLAEADYAISKADFLAKIHISIKECSETLYWLRLLNKTKYLTDKEFSSIYGECEELMWILTASVKTVKTNMGKTKKQ